MIGLIVARSKNNVIGKNGKIPWKIKGEQKQFRELTSGNVVIMGRNTYEEIGHPLPNRKNIIVSRSKSFEGENLVTAKSLKEAIELAGNADTYIAGGYGLFKEALPIVDKMFITEVDIEIEDGDVLFPEFKVDEFNVSVGEISGDDIKYTRVVYTRKLKNKYDAVVFDMDGIIFDSERAIMDCWVELADKYGIENMEEAFLACIGTTMARTREIMLARYGDSFPYDVYAKEASLMYHSKYDGGRLPMKKGVIELLIFLKGEGKKIALASSTRRQTVMSQLKDSGILDYFDAVICGDMVEKSKPEPDIFLKACEEINVLPEKAYGIEDSYNGIRAAYAGKLRPIMVPDLLPENEEMEKLAEVILKDLLEVKEYLR